jgi:hypothetical protein
LYSDSTFVVNATKALLVAMNDANLSVRTKASWSLGNLCDALISVPTMASYLSDNLLTQIAKSALKGSNDNDKVKSNAVRALGNFGRCCPRTVLEADNGFLLNRIIESVVTALNTGSVKVQWNACYALGNIFRNLYVQTLIPEAPWTTTIYSSLNNLIRDSKNFKTRINAASAMAVLPARKHFGKFYYEIIQTLLEALETIDDKVDFAEFKYKETLQDQVTRCVTSLTLLDHQHISLFDTVEFSRRVPTGKAHICRKASFHHILFGTASTADRRKSSRFVSKLSLGQHSRMVSSSGSLEKANSIT